MKSSKCLTIAAIAALIVGVAGCREKGESKSEKSQTEQAQTKQVQVEEPLENRVKSILNNLHSELSEGEMDLIDYHLFLFAELQEKGIFNGIFSPYCYDSFNLPVVNYIGMLLEYKLPARRLAGLTSDYVALETTPLSDKTKADIAAYETLKIDLYKYLKENIGNKPISAEKFEDVIIGYIDSTRPNGLSYDDIGPIKWRNISYKLLNTWRGEFNILPALNEPGYRSRSDYMHNIIGTVENALNKIEPLPKVIKKP